MPRKSTSSANSQAGAKPTAARGKHSTPADANGVLAASTQHETAEERRERGKRIVAELRALYPEAKCSLDFTTPLELLVATMLSAQCTDERVNAVTPALFARYRSAADFAAAPQEEMEAAVKQTGFYRNKATHIRAAARVIAEQHGGEVPHEMAALVALPGVARKTANVVLGNAYGIIEGFVVDTHVGRIARRLGLTESDDPVKVEQDLMAIFDQPDWLDLSHMLIAHGRAICQARRPLCERCTLAPICPTGQANLSAWAHQEAVPAKASAKK